MCTHTHMYMKGSRQRQQHNQRACSLCVGVPGAHGLQSPSENWHHVRYTCKKNKKKYMKNLEPCQVYRTGGFDRAKTHKGHSLAPPIA